MKNRACFMNRKEAGPYSLESMNTGRHFTTVPVKMPTPCWSLSCYSIISTVNSSGSTTKNEKGLWLTGFGVVNRRRNADVDVDA